jgi:hypothetical protein
VTDLTPAIGLLLFGGVVTLFVVAMFVHQRSRVVGLTVLGLLMIAGSVWWLLRSMGTN